jgi:hypothetical protein
MLGSTGMVAHDFRHRALAWRSLHLSLVNEISSSASLRAPASRSLVPREHGAYGQLAMPLVAALAMGRPGGASVLLTAASVAAFVAHEPLLVLLGQRGSRARRDDGPRALRLLASLGGAALACGVVGIAIAPAAAQRAVLVPAALAIATAAFIARGEEKTTAGEILAAAALSSAALPVAISSGAGAATAWGALAAWCLGFAAATWAVRAVIAHRKEAWSLAKRALPLALPAGLALALATHGFALAAASAPVILFAIALAFAPPSPRALRRVGWGIVASTALTAALIVAGAHL